MVRPEQNFKLRHLPSLLGKTFSLWFNDHPFRLSAIVAYYAVISLPALLVITINVVGSVWGYEIVQGKLTAEFSAVLGKDVAGFIESIITETQKSEKNTISTVLGIGTLLFGATGVFYQLKISLNKIWKVDTTPQSRLWAILVDRLLSFAFVLVLGFLLLVSFVLTTAISMVSDYIRETMPDIFLYVAYSFDLVISIGLITLLFALIFKFLPDVKVKWKTVWIGALITSILFAIGKFLLGLYFGEAEPASTYGAAGTVVLVLLWVSYSSLILFFGAEFTYVYAERYGYGIKKN
jgi:membrane protein